MYRLLVNWAQNTK